MRDVARMAGVSAKTVSRVVNDDPAVHSETRDAILAVIRQLDYVPDHAARMMRAGTSSVVGLMTDVVATTPYSVDIVRGAQDALRRDGRTLLIANTEGDRVLEREYWRMFRAHKVSGVIYATMYHRPLDLGEPEFARTIVLANCFSPKGDCPAIVPDDELGGYAQAAHLLRLGHRRIGIVSLNPVLRASVLRGAGFRTAFAEFDVPFEPDLERPGFTGPIGEEMIVAYEAALDLLRRPNRPTAIICGNDKIAMQVYGAAASLGLSIPQDLSVMGFDDMTVIAETLRPALTTVGLPYFEIGRRSVEIMAGLPAAPQAERHQPILVPCPLVERDSCRAIA
nr:LacI family DNA-binding transcriptional regulator [Chthonobacter rhizosphaerae]